MMWEAFVKFMTGKFAGQSTLWSVIEARLNESKFNSDVNHLIDHILDTNPHIDERISDLSGMFNKRGDPIHLHAFPIGLNMWISRSPSIPLYHIHNIYISDVMDDSFENASHVYCDGVVVPGTWQSHVVRVLEIAAAEANELQRDHKASIRDRDLTRANSI